jgi:hypothetical protein
MAVFDLSEFEISAPQCPTQHSPGGNGDVLDIVGHKDIKEWNIIVSDILNSVHLPVIIHILDNVRNRNFSEPIEKLTD